VARYLEPKLEESAEIYVKSRFIAEDIEPSAKEISSHIRTLQDVSHALDIAVGLHQRHDLARYQQRILMLSGQKRLDGFSHSVGSNLYL